MAKKKNKETGRSPYLGTIIFVIVAVAAGVIALKYIEKQKIHSQLLENSEKLNLSLESSLFKAGLSKKDIVSSSEELREIENGKILFCKRVVLLKKGLAAEDLEVIVRKLAKIKGVEIEKAEDNDVAKKQGIKLIVRLHTFPVQELIIYPALQDKISDRTLTKDEPAKNPVIAIIIDDIGGSLKQAKPFLAINEPINFAILPNLSFSKKISRLAGKSGKEVLLHCPMEPEEYPKADPGPGGIFLKMKKNEILETLNENLDSVPNAVGFNNHMGSRLTQEKKKMEIVLSWAKKKNLFFIDSRTTPKTIGAETARELSIKTAERKVFLDNIREIPEIEKEISRLAEFAKKDGKAIGIGHPYPETAAAIQMMIPKLKNEGIEFVPVSEIVE